MKDIKVGNSFQNAVIGEAAESYMLQVGQPLESSLKSSEVLAQTSNAEPPVSMNVSVNAGLEYKAPDPEPGLG